LTRGLWRGGISSKAQLLEVVLVLAGVLRLVTDMI